jgi:toxin ParE1/3/4
MRLRYTADALAHLSSIRDFLIERNPAVARRILADVRGAASRLCEFPELGRSSDWPDTREWVVQRTPYISVYQVERARDEVTVLGVFHGSQDWQGSRP